MIRVLLAAALLVLAAATAPAGLRGHTAVQWARPADGDTLAAAPAEVRLRFTGRVEGALTVLTVLRGGVHVAAGGRMVEGSAGREYVLPFAAPLGPGTYTVQWRTVGADGHALEGRWSFVVEGEAADEPPLPAAAEPVTAAPAEPPAAAEPPTPVSDPVAAAVRWLWFASLLGIVGAVAFRFGVLGPLERGGAHTELAARAEAGTWLVALAAAALSAISLLARLWVQAQSLGGGPAWEGDRLRLLLTGTSWGLAWTLQAIATVAFVVGLLVARAPHGRAAGWMGAGVGALLLSAVPALSGHAVAVEGWAGLAILSDALHVAGAGAWVGTLAVLAAVGIPAALSAPEGRGPAVAALVRAFSPVALAAAGVVAATGIANAAFQLSAFGDLWASAYGRVLLLKLALLAGVAALGWYHWRRAGPALGTDDAVPALRRSLRAELALGALVLAATAVLVAMPTP